ncbi:hypothetical protein J6590_040565 [Homalodisca vitripennis]|nr:hypothetical protein J6590_040565 [Homalodisca vitripennis]
MEERYRELILHCPIIHIYSKSTPGTAWIQQKKSQLQFSAQRSRAGKVARHDMNLR